MGIKREEECIFMGKEEKRKKDAETSELDLPIVTSIALEKVGEIEWQTLVYQTKGDRVLSVEPIGKPNIRQIIEAEFKMTVARRIFARQ
jgi:hypothetical protein